MMGSIEAVEVGTVFTGEAHGRKGCASMEENNDRSSQGSSTWTRTSSTDNAETKLGYASSRINRKIDGRVTSSSILLDLLPQFPQHLVAQCRGDLSHFIH